MLMLKCRNKNAVPRALILGASRGDADRLLRGESVDHQYAGSPIPDDAWPPEEYRDVTIAITSEDLADDDTGFALVAITREAAESDAIVATAARRLIPGGRLWIEPAPGVRV